MIEDIKYNNTSLIEYLDDTDDNLFIKSIIY